ncbi:vacuolar ATPase assembly integral membrane protein VMA21 homolog [Bemisia tabaci]|uniref:vacuolar ATPase assembly integral membrane protein VMA21 homolog n=1 Tax=Bemisia tabaci TaxID=7038 RepID=UPI003B28CE05
MEQTVLIQKETPDFVIFRTIFYYCFVIIVFPVLSFFSAKFIVFSGSDSISSNVYSAALAVIVLHVTLGAFIYKAYSDTGTKPSKQD